MTTMFETRASAILTVDLDAIAANYRLLAARAKGTTCAKGAAGAVCAAVVKADAYGLGMAKVAPILEAAGCTRFFVAHIDEGIVARALLDDAEIYILNGLIPGTEGDLERHGLVPVLNSPPEIEAWAAYAGQRGKQLAAVLHLDTGMSRLGLTEGDVARLAEQPELLAGLSLAFVMSHLACADEPLHPMNRGQLDCFNRLRALLPEAPACLSASSGIFLGKEWHLDMVRPGAALYGLAPDPSKSNPLAQVVRLQGRILQVRDVDSPTTVGYGATHPITRKSRLATVAVGYADGYLRSLSNRGSGFVGDIRVPLVGRVSMDLITFDVSEVPAQCVMPGAMLDLIGPHNPADSLADAAGTIGYEILTSLGRRYHRRYVSSLPGDVV